MTTWWKEVLTEEETFLLDALFAAHYRSAFRQNTSSVTVANVADSSNDIGKAIAAGILCLGDRHGPLQRTYEFLSLDQPWAKVDNRATVPGWGGTFQKDHPDPYWVVVDDLLGKYHPQLYQKIELITKWLHSCGKTIYPNPSAYTAAVGIVLGLPPKLLIYLFIKSRLDAWARIALAGTERTQIVWDTEP